MYGGGGITPDEKFETPKLDSSKWNCSAAGSSTSRARTSRNTRPRCPKGWMPDEQVIEELHEFLLQSGTKFTEAEFTQGPRLDQALSCAKRCTSTAFNVDESDRMFAQTDPEVGACHRGDAEGAGSAGDRPQDRRAAHGAGARAITELMRRRRESCMACSVRLSEGTAHCPAYTEV